jgi:alpha/beta superfamily hydrolase
VTDPITIASRDGLKLECALDRPVGEVRGGLVFCHPHPRYGGTMDAPLLHALRDTLVARGWAVLRFNFRGVGDSEGESSLGVDEVADVQGALDRLEQDVDAPLALAGWSFGGGVAIRTAALERSRVKACVGIAPAVEHKKDIAEGLPPPAELGPIGPLLLVVGANDTTVTPEAVRRWADQADDATVVTIPGANHFFWARYEELATTVGDWLDEVV